MQVILDSSLPVILIDTSYYIFYRYFSTLKWYQFRNKEIDVTKIHEDEVFMTALFKHTLVEFQTMAKKWNTKLSQIIFCCDCSRDTIWRNQHTDCYKQSRVPNPNFNSHIFFKFYEYLEKHREEWGIHLLVVENLEADDIAYLTKKTLQEKGWNQDIMIVTNDNDYLQLLDSQTKIYNLNGKWVDLSTRSCGDPKKDLKIKLIMGDKSDNIVAIHAGIGPKTAMKLASMDDVEFEKYLEEKNCKETYLKNKTLVDFTMIPAEYMQLFDYTFEWCMK
jgi:5'-3' exonuclease